MKSNKGKVGDIVEAIERHSNRDDHFLKVGRQYKVVSVIGEGYFVQVEGNTWDYSMERFKIVTTGTTKVQSNSKNIQIPKML